MSTYFSEEEVRRRIEERKLYCDAYEGLEGLKSERDRAKRLVARFNRTTVDDEALTKNLLWNCLVTALRMPSSSRLFRLLTGTAQLFLATLTPTRV